MASNELVTDVYPYFRVYKDGRVERCYDENASGLFYVPPSLEQDPTTGVSSKDVTISPHVSARLYLPNNVVATDQKLPVLVYYHGGGLVVGSAYFHLFHHYLNILVSESQAIAVSVEYRLAPEHDVSTIYQDSWTALQWVASHANKNPTMVNGFDSWLTDHGDFSRFFVAGDSAGGNIVYNVAMRAGEEGIRENVVISGSILTFPYFLIPIEGIEQTISYKIWMNITSPSDCGIDSPMINPLSEKAPCLSGLGCSRMFMCIGEKDELVPREIGIRFVEGLKKSGWRGELEFLEIKGIGHCFQLRNPEKAEKAQDLIKRLASFIQQK